MRHIIILLYACASCENRRRKNTNCTVVYAFLNSSLIEAYLSWVGRWWEVCSIIVRYTTKRCSATAQSVDEVHVHTATSRRVKKAW